SWGALPLTYSDGTRIDYDVSASSAADWTYWNVRDQNLFAEATYQLNDDWSLKATSMYRRNDEQARLLYPFTDPSDPTTYPDPVTVLGVPGYSPGYQSKHDQYIFDASVSGALEMFGRRHEISAGINAAYGHNQQLESVADTYPLLYPPVQNWGAEQI